MEEKMNRMEFLKSLGLKGASLFAVYCAASGLSSCVNESMDPTLPPPSSGGTNPPANTNELVLDLTSSTYSKLNTVGNYVIVNSIVIARVSNTAFAAVTQVCTHEGKKKVYYRTNEFYCPEHGARFDMAGKGLNANGSKGLKTYRTELKGTSLTLFL